MDYSAPPPPYTPHHPRPVGPATLKSLPLNTLYYIVSLTLDAKATPSQWASDPEEERIRRIWALFRGLRGVDRRFYLVSTSLLRELYYRQWMSKLVGQSTDAFPHDTSSSVRSHQGTFVNGGTDGGSNVFISRSRETAVFDRWIAATIGEELRRVESELSEEGDGSRYVVSKIQPSARIEDLLLHLPTSLIIPSTSSSPLRGQFPLPHNHLSISTTPTRIQMYLHTSPVAPTGTPSVGKGSKELVVEIRRDISRKNLDDRYVLEIVTALGDELDDVIAGKKPWGSHA